ncbi:hypothetical protein CAPTEDRAFT_191474 [Capitella teleta]|uniref:G-protein coupled receptors family 1 profile domain-containing protein n=1 Tax=Capitella teleta TaxID=283909 RepID=R7U1R0_CAPTE|nr:hypothetical protein CAPTEDRAFT_191474 [Capitella teleta]|eukprot:ELU00164.1 hypothetical protein CAPTEDRAFT_191474 [Capitella teleta]
MTPLIHQKGQVHEKVCGGNEQEYFVMVDLENGTNGSTYAPNGDPEDTYKYTLAYYGCSSAIGLSVFITNLCIFSLFVFVAKIRQVTDSLIMFLTCADALMGLALFTGGIHASISNDEDFVTVEYKDGTFQGLFTGYGVYIIVCAHLIAIYGRIGFTAFAQRRKIQATDHREPPSKAMRTLGKILGSFLIFWFPYFLCFGYYLHLYLHNDPDQYSPLLRLWVSYTIIIGYFNSLSNVFIYTLGTPAYKEWFRKKFGKIIASLELC